MLLTSSRVPAPRASSRRPVSQTAATTPSAIINPYAWIDSGPISSTPLEGLGMPAGSERVTR